VDVRATDLERLYVAGAFGTHLEAERALGTGLIPPMDAGRVQAVGNAAGQGAVFVLLDRKLRGEAETIAVGAEYIELSGSATFSRRYIACMELSAT